MIQSERIETKRLILRPFRKTDAVDVQRLAGEFEVADTTLNIPHPYPMKAAVEWIQSHPGKLKNKSEIIFAITLESDESLIGSIGLILDLKHNQAEMGYWIGKPYWNSGYATEAAKAMLDFAFYQLELKKVHAHYMSRNPASGRVMQKIGMKHERTLRKHVKKWDKMEDIEIFTIRAFEFVHKANSS